MSIAYYNGKFSEIDEVRIPLCDRCIFFGEGIYEVLIGKSGRLYLLDEHLNRFFRNAKSMNYNFSTARGELTDLLYECVRRGEEDVFTVYFQLTRSQKERRHDCDEGAPTNLLIMLTPTPIPNTEKRIKLLSYPDLRYSYCNVKTLNLLPAVICATDAKRRGADEAVLIKDGTVTECAHSNVSIIKNGTLYTHPECERILPGIMRSELLKACREMEINYEEKAFSYEELLAADEVIVSSSTKLLRLAEEIDGVKISAKHGSLGEKLTKKVHFSFVNLDI